MSGPRAAALFATDPFGLGGVLLRGRIGPARDAFLQAAMDLLPEGTPLRRVPASITDERLLGGLDLAATLSAGRPVLSRGLLAEADGGVLILPMAERVAQGACARIAAAMDRGMVAIEREGFGTPSRAVFGVIALDEGHEDEHAPEALADRLALHVACDSWEDDDAFSRTGVEQARARLPGVSVPDEIVTELVATAAALGIDSVRPALFAIRAARALAALAGRDCALKEDAVSAVRLVLAMRARALPPMAEAEDEQPAGNAQPEGGGEDNARPQSDENNQGEGRETEDRGATDPQTPRQAPETIVEAVRAALPPEALAQLAIGQKGKRAGPHGRGGVGARSMQRGRPTGAWPGKLGSGARLALLETLRAAAPFQALRRGEADARQGASILVRPEDIRIRRFKARERTTTIFVVDASGSLAMHRLAEAKGAVQALLAECYVRRDEVALIAFRGRGAELLLAPTRSLTRVRRSLSRLPGGGGTPLAAGLALAVRTAEQAARFGASPAVVVLTDGQANVGLDGVGGRARAEADSLAAARTLRARNLPAMVIDTSPRARPEARRLAAEMGARYAPLPSADPAMMARAIRFHLTG